MTKGKTAASYKTAFRPTVNHSWPGSSGCRGGAFLPVPAAVGACYSWILGPARGHLKPGEPNCGGVVVSGVSGAVIGTCGRLHPARREPHDSVFEVENCLMRPRRLSPSILSELVEVLADGNYISTACQYVGVGESTTTSGGRVAAAECPALFIGRQARFGPEGDLCHQQGPVEASP